jgi:hypothetical protein
MIQKLIELIASFGLDSDPSFYVEQPLLPFNPDNTWG